ncbi:MAG TPA: hypothetical protein VI322_03985 [Candidatus Saccharimonadia bacterium]
MLGTRFREATGGRFVIEDVPDSGGDSNADAIISGGLDYAAYERGYFKEGDAPDLDEIARILTEVIDDLVVP